MNAIRKKPCTKCGVPKGPQCFYLRKPGQRMTMCKECHLVQVVARNEVFTEQRKAYMREYNKLPRRRAEFAARAKTEKAKHEHRLYWRFKKLMEGMAA